LPLISHKYRCLLLTGALLLAGCSHKRPAQANLPPPPPDINASTTTNPPGAATTATISKPSPAWPPPASKLREPLFVQTGLASWYGPTFNHRRTSSGEIYDMQQLTAAHRTLPLNTRARVTDLATGKSVVVRITDRGPFVPGRVIDLSLAAAREVGLYQRGTAQVRLEVLESPASLDSGGRWAVQIGAFRDSAAAEKLKGRLSRRYHSAKVLDFSGPNQDWWVRVRVLNDDRGRAEQVARENQTPEGAIFLVRLD
jgi:rare lipoprotein A